MRHTHGLRHAVLGIVSRRREGIHGYAAKQDCDRMLGGFWRLNFGEVYRILDRLVEEELIEQIATQSLSQRARKVYRITDKGRQSLDAFILAPPTDAPRPLRHELAVKLLFAGPERRGAILDLVRHQREVYARQLQLVGLDAGNWRGYPWTASSRVC
jgi:PadR family transcriptional regulator AphA